MPRIHYKTFVDLETPPCVSLTLSVCHPILSFSLFFTSFLLWKDRNVSISRIERMAGMLHHLERIGAWEAMLAATLAYMHEQTWQVAPKKTKNVWRYSCARNSPSPIRFQIRSSQTDGIVKHYNHDYHTSVLAIHAWESTPIAPIYGLHYTGAITRAATLNCYKRFISSLYFGWLEELFLS